MEAAQSVMVKLHTETPFWAEPLQIRGFSVPFCQPMDCRVQEILQAGISEWVALLFSRGDLPNPGTKPRSPALRRQTLYQLSHREALSASKGDVMGGVVAARGLPECFPASHLAVCLSCTHPPPHHPSPKILQCPPCSQHKGQ